MSSAAVADLEALYRSRYGAFARVAGAIAGVDDAGDAVDEAFATAILKLGSYRGSGSLEAWVWSIVLNAARALARKRRGELLRESGAVADSVLSEADAEVRGWIAGLPERQRLAVFLRYFADLDYPAIAQSLGIEVGTVSATLSAAHAALRRSSEEAHV
ncbi:MAG TPA: sigma-70 family RNA polymerase sigma factor [Gaiellaceae bacterium]|nr:sigma-70 family RNA polymerase sigma factor [Gaiellaceae bacterium]